MVRGPGIGASKTVDPLIDHYRSSRPAIEYLELDLGRPLHIGLYALHSCRTDGGRGRFRNPVGTVGRQVRRDLRHVTRSKGCAEIGHQRQVRRFDGCRCGRCHRNRERCSSYQELGTSHGVSIVVASPCAGGANKTEPPIKETAIPAGSVW